jgi:hypothetical protein
VANQTQDQAQKPPYFSSATATFVGLIFYLVLVAGPPVLKLAGHTRLAAASWLQATALLWAPWLLVAAAWLLVGLVRVGEKLVKIKIHNNLTVPRS